MSDGRVVPYASDDAHARAREFASLAPERARFENLRAATAGFADPSLMKSGFYPRGRRSSSERLSFYATQFSFVEIDATFYALPDPATCARWVAATPEDFLFHIKAHPVLTKHGIDVARLPGDLKAALVGRGRSESRLRAEDIPEEIGVEIETRFFAALGPLIEARRLAFVLVQLPPWFRATRGNAAYLEALRARYPEVPFSVEFRSADWLEPSRAPRVFDLLRRNGLAYVIVDEPELGRFSPFVPEVTGETAIVRLHGRNREGWSKKGASVLERFNYLYSSDELRSLASALGPVRERAKEVHVVLNNCLADYAVLGAKGIARAFAEVAS